MERTSSGEQVSVSGCKHGKVDNLDPYIGLSDSVSKPYSHFEFCEEKNHKQLMNMLIYKANQFMLNIFFKRNVYIF